MERRTFEEEFKKAFNKAEVSPSDNVWTNIELDLMKAESSKMKRRVLFYQLLAAASITFAVLMVGVGYYVYQSNPEQGTIALNKSSQPSAQEKERTNSENSSTPNQLNSREGEGKPSRSADQGSAVSGNDEKTPSSNGEKLVSETPENRNQVQGESNTEINQQEFPINEIRPEGKQELVTESVDRISGDVAVLFNETAADQNDITGSQNRNGRRNFVETNARHNDVAVSAVSSEQSDMSDSKSLPSLYSKRNIQPDFNRNPEPVTADPVALMMAKLKDLERELAGRDVSNNKNKNSGKENLWTSVGFAAGGFNTTNPNVSSASQSNMAFSNTVNNQSKASGVSYSFGLSMGTKITERLVLQGGVNYLTQNSSYTSEQVVGSVDLQNFKAATLNDFRQAEAANVISTAPYSVNNNVEFVSIPMQAGYVVINKKVALQLNAGVSTDFFLKNTIDPEGSSLQKTTQDRGADSPYRSLNFSGLVNTELSYRLNNRYRIAINPGLRYPFNSIYKDEVGVNATPLTFDVGLRFRYIFQ